jgi:hypothetical protein
MRKLFCIVVIISLSLSGCFIKKMTSDPNCKKPVQAFKNIILNVNTDNIMLVDEPHVGVPKEQVRDIIADEAEKELNDEFGKKEGKAYLTISKSKGCDDKSVMVDGTVTYIRVWNEHGRGFNLLTQKMKYEGRLTYKLINCATKKVINSEKMHDDTEDFVNMAEKLGGELGSKAVNDLTSCSK